MDDIEAARAFVNRHIPKGYEESSSGPMILWQVPLADYPQTYNKKPLQYVGLAAKKGYNALYLTGCYMQPALAKKLQEAYAKAGRKLDMGMGCLRFKSFDDLLQKALGEVIAALPQKKYIALHEAARAKRSR
jgi:hypothetical protein